MIDRNQGNPFKKRHYVRLIKRTVRDVARIFGYKRPPFIRETRWADGVMMAHLRFTESARHCGVFYDYENFRRAFRADPFDVQAVMAVFFTAHEMRHHYQTRQLFAKVPSESPKTLEAWRNGELPDDFTPSASTNASYARAPRELDANLFAYVYTANECGLRMTFYHVDDDYIRDLEDAYIALFGETDEWLFPPELTGRASAEQEENA